MDLCRDCQLCWTKLFDMSGEANLCRELMKDANGCLQSSSLYKLLIF